MVNIIENSDMGFEDQSPSNPTISSEDQIKEKLAKLSKVFTRSKKSIGIIGGNINRIKEVYERTLKRKLEIRNALREGKNPPEEISVAKNITEITAYMAALTLDKYSSIFGRERFKELIGSVNAYRTEQRNIIKGIDSEINDLKTEAERKQAENKEIEAIRNKLAA